MSSKSFLTPMLGDMVLFRDREDKRIFGIITEILKKNRVLVRCISDDAVLCVVVKIAVVNK